jgi:hypothetical protein
LLFYYCGHGALDEDGVAHFVTYEADGERDLGWPVPSAVNAIDDHFAGSHVLLLADCCYAGSLADHLPRLRRPAGVAALASSRASELSTGNWTFTEQIVAAFDGRAFSDADGSGVITLSELAGQVMATMAFAEDQRATFALSNRFPADMVLGPARPRTHARIGECVEALSGDSWYRAQIVDGSEGLLRVHYFGYGDDEDEWLPPSNLRPRHRPTHNAGTPVEVNWKSEWYPARILAVEHGLHHIRYDGFGPEWDEWVGAARIRAA